MSHIRRVVIWAGLTVLLAPGCYAQSVSRSSELALRDSFAEFQAALTRRDVPALKEFLTPDAVWVFPQSNSKDSADAVASYVATFLNLFDLRFEIVRVKMHEANTRAALVLRGQHLGLPKQDGKYVMVWNRDPLFARWRLENEKWRLYYMTDNPTEASAMAQAEGLE
jgi:ketosteroid isomerase-like protein